MGDKITQIAKLSAEHSMFYWKEKMDAQMSLADFEDKVFEILKEKK